MNLTPEQKELFAQATDNLEHDVAVCVSHLRDNLTEEMPVDNKVALDTIVFSIQYLSDCVKRLAGVEPVALTEAFDEFEAENVVSAAMRIVRGEDGDATVAL